MASVSVLIVDDNTNWRKTLRRILADKNYRIVDVKTGEEALDRISREYFDVVLVDYKLGSGCDGLEVINKAKQLELKMGVAFLVTGYTTVTTAIAAYEAGVFAFLNKGEPDFLQQLRIRVAEAVTAATAEV